MPNQSNRLVQDALLVAAAFALPAAASTTVTSAAIDINADSFKSPEIDLLLTIPALSTTIVPDASTVTAIIETSTVSNFATIDATIFSRVLTGAGGAGVPAQNALTCRLPGNCAQFVRGKVTFGASTTTGAALSATFGVRF